MSQSPLTTDDFVFLDALAREVRANAGQYSAAAKQIAERYSLAACRQREADIRRRTRVETQLGAPIRKARHRASDFTPVKRLGLAVQSHRQLYLDDRAYALWLDHVAALEIVFLTWLMVDTDSHELKSLKCEFQQLPWAFNTKIEGQLLQGRQVVAADLLDEVWLELAHAAWVKIEKPGANESVPSQGGMSWGEAQEKAESHVRAHDGVVPSVQRLATIVGCSRPTIDKAIERSAYLKARKAERGGPAKPREVPLSDDHIKETPQQTESNDQLAGLIKEQNAEAAREERQQRVAKKARKRGGPPAKW